MTPGQLETVARAIHDAYMQFHVNRYKIDFRPWEDTSQLEKQMYMCMAEGAYTAVGAMEGARIEDVQQSAEYRTAPATTKAKEPTT